MRVHCLTREFHLQDVSMSELDDTLAAAREAYGAASQALRLAEEAAGKAGVATLGSVLDELTVKRLNVVEDDGTLRIVIGNSTHGRTAPMRGRLVEHPGRNASAGLLFVNDEGTECGGLQYAGFRGADGKEQMGYLTVDDYEQNESLRMGMFQNGDASQKFVEFTDQPAWSIVDKVEGAEGRDAAALESYLDEVDGRGRSRMRLAREEDGSVRLVLRDREGRDRLRFIVPGEGDAVVEVVDPEGNARSLL
jgi:hypothetical protein